MSRWHAGPTTFGPVGRVLATALVLALGPWNGFSGFSDAAGPLMIWYLLGWTILAVWVLRHVWRKERIADPTVAAREGMWSRLGRRVPALGRPVPPVLVLGVLGATALVTLLVLWVNLDTEGRFYLLAVGGTAGTGLFLVVWNEL